MKLQEFSLFYYCIWLFTFFKMSIPQYHPISLYHSDIISWGAFCKVFICRLQLNFQIFRHAQESHYNPKVCKETKSQKTDMYLKNWQRAPQGFDFRIFYRENRSKWATNKWFSKFAQNSPDSDIYMKQVSKGCTQKSGIFSTAGALVVITV